MTKLVYPGCRMRPITGDSFGCQRVGCGSPKGHRNFCQCAMKVEKFPLEDMEEGIHGFVQLNVCHCCPIPWSFIISCWPQYVVTSHSFTDEHRRE